MADLKRLSEISMEMAQQSIKIAQALMVFVQKGYLPSELKGLFLGMAALAQEGGEKSQPESKATPCRC